VDQRDTGVSSERLASAAQQYCDVWINIAAQRSAACGGGDLDSHRARVVQTVGLGICERIRSSVRAGGLVFDPEMGEACLRSIADSSCESLGPTYLLFGSIWMQSTSAALVSSSCVEALRGGRGETEPCSYVNECRPGLVCDNLRRYSGNCTHTCLARSLGGVGADCRSGLAGCRSGLACILDVCAELPGAGEVCLLGQCGPNAFCDEADQCQTNSALGGRCSRGSTGYFSCLPDASSCAGPSGSEVCKVSLLVGELCRAGEYECGPEAYCRAVDNETRCALRPIAGESCRTGGPEAPSCWTRSICNEGSGVCFVPKVAGELCDRFDECVSLSCVDGICADHPGSCP